MKKFIYLFLTIMILGLPFSVDAKKTTTKAKDPVNLYVFYGDGCGYCAKLHEFTDELQNDKTMKKKFKLVDYEVWNNQTNNDLMQKVGSYFNYSVSGVPFYVVGEQYFSGWDDDSGDTLVDAINEEYKNSGYHDVVKDIKDGVIEVDSSSTGDNSSTTSNSDSGVAYVILGVTIIVVLAIIFGRNKNSEEEVEEVIEQEKPAKKTTTTTTKKKTTKKTTKK